MPLCNVKFYQFLVCDWSKKVDQSQTPHYADRLSSDNRSHNPSNQSSPLKGCSAILSLTTFCKNNSNQFRLTSQTPTPTRMKHLDLDKKSTKVPDPSLKDIQKKALLSFYERHQHNNNTWRAEKQTAQAQQPVSHSRSILSKNKVALPTRRASSASDYASLKNTRRSSFNTDLNCSENATGECTYLIFLVENFWKKYRQCMDVYLHE